MDATVMEKPRQGTMRLRRLHTTDALDCPKRAHFADLHDHVKMCAIGGFELYRITGGHERGVRSAELLAGRVKHTLYA